MRTRITLVVLVLSLLVVGPAAAGQLFAPGYYPDQVSVFNTDASGAATLVAGQPFPIGAFPLGDGLGSIALTPDGTRAVATYYFNGGIQGLTVAASGAIGTAAPVTGNDKGTYVAITPDGSRVYQAIGGATNGLAGYAIQANGTLTALPGSPYYTSTSFNDVVISPDGKFAYATDGTSIRPFVVNSDGSLTAQAATPTGLTYHMMFASDGKHIALAGGTALKAVAINPDGSIGTVGAPVTVSSASLYIAAISADGRSVFGIDYNGDTLGGGKYSINTYRIGADSSLTFMGAGATLPFRGRGIGVAPDGKTIYLGTDDNKLVYAPLDANGVVAGTFKETGAWPSGEATPFVFRPVFAPMATFKPAPVSKVLTMRFDGKDTTSPDGSVDGYSWDFGDDSNESAGSAVAMHKFAKPGRYVVTLTASNDGCADRNLFTGHMMVCNGAPGAAKKLLVDTPPWITSLKVAKNKIKFKLTEKASVSFYAQKPVKGRTVGSKCKKQSAKNRSGKKCTLWVRASKTFRASGKARKTNSLKFTGRIGKARLAKGRYRLYGVATDSAKGKGPAVTAKFKIKR